MNRPISFFLFANGWHVVDIYHNFAWGNFMNKRACILTVLSLAAILAGNAVPACTHGSLEDRCVLEDREPLASLSSGRGPAEWTFVLSGKFDPRNDGLALLVQLESPAQAPHLVVNGRFYTSAPLPRGEGGYLYNLPAADIDPDAENSISVIGDEGNPITPREMILYPIDGGFESAHFNQVFHEPRAERRATPALHPSQTLYDAISYDIDLEVDMTSRYLEGTVVATLESLTDGLDTLALDFQTDSDPDSCQITSVVAVPPVPGMTYSVDLNNDWMVVELPADSELNTGEQITLRIEYDGEPTSSAGAFGLNSYNRTTQPNGTPIVYTFSQPYSARSWWPCKDVTFDKALVDISITVDDQYMVITNGVLQNEETPAAGKKRYNYSHGYPVATYLVAFCATKYLYHSGTYTALDGTTTMEVGHWVYETSADELAAVPDTIDIMEFYASRFGEYPFLDESYVTMTWGASFGMEHQTCTSINNRNLANGGKSRRNVHELMHMWFGDMVTPVDFEHLWLNEGYATYAEALYVEHDQGEAAFQATVQGFINNGINDSTPLVNPNADQFAGSLVYRKGGIVLHMLRGVVGDDDFFAASRNYLNAHAYGIVETQDLQDAMEAQSGMDLQPFFDQWVYGTGYPEYSWSWSQDGDTLTIVVAQTQSEDTFVMPIQIQVDYASAPSEVFRLENNLRTQSFDLDVTGKSVVDVDFDPDNWIYDEASEEVLQPAQPVLQTAVGGSAPGTIDLQWLAGSGGTVPTVGYQVHAGSSPESIGVALDENDLGAGAVSATLSGLTDGQATYVAVYAVAAGGTLSERSDLYGAVPGSASQRVLIVDGYDRDDIQGPNHDWAAWHGQSVAAYGAAFDCHANEALAASVDPADYKALVWVLGEESTFNRTFDEDEKTLAEGYLQNGGALFVTGAEIGWDLGRSQSPNDDFDFYNNYLKASYVSDDSLSYTASGEPGGPLEGLGFSYGSGTGIYYPDWPDVLSPAGGGAVALRYGSDSVAGVSFSGTFPGGSATGHLIYLGFPFETISTQTDRDAVMAAVLEFFGIEPDQEAGIGNSFMIY